LRCCSQPCLCWAACWLGVAAGAGYVVGDEINEGDGKFDPLEDARGKGNGKN